MEIGLIIELVNGNKTPQYPFAPYKQESCLGIRSFIPLSSCKLFLYT